MTRKMVTLGLLAGLGTVLSGCLATLHNVAIHGAQVIQTWDSLTSLGLL